MHERSSHFEITMVGKVEKKRADLKNRLIDIAELKINEGGIELIRARDLAAEAGCAVGAIYNVFGDLNDLTMEVNGRTFKQLGRHVSRAVTKSDSQDPAEVLVAMGHAYLDFATHNTLAWRTLFDLEMSTNQQVPSWYLAELDKLLSLIAAPLLRLHPEMERDEVMLMTRALFSSVHGIVLLGLEKRISAVPTEHLENMISSLLKRLA